MPQWYQCKLTHQQEMESGRLQTINETILVDSMSFTEAEARVVVLTDGKKTVKAITRVKYVDVYDREEQEKWWAVKLVYFSIDERSGKEKKVVNPILVAAYGVQDAIDFMKDVTKGMLVPWEIEAVVLTPISEVHFYDPWPEAEQES